MLGPRDLPHLASVDYAREHLLLAVLVALARSAEGAARGSRSLSPAAAEGEVRGEARTLLKLLRLRGFPVDDATAERVLATTDVALLDRWVERSIAARSLEEVLSG